MAGTSAKPSGVASSFSRMSFAAGVVAASVGALVLLGWALDAPRLESLHPKLVSMKANTAAGFVLAGIALCVLVDERRSALARRLGRTCAVLAALVGLLALAEDVFTWNLGIDELLVTDPRGAVGSASPGRMAPTPAAAFLLLGAALLFLDRETKRGRRPAQWLALAAGFVAVLTLIGQVFGVETFLGVGLPTQVAVHTMAADLVLCLGLLFARPQHGMMGTVTSFSGAGRMARRMLPATILVPLVVGGLCVLGQRVGLYGMPFAMTLFLATQIALLLGLTWWNASSLHQAESEQRRAEAEVQRSEQSLARTLDSIGDAVIATDRRGYVVRMNPVAERLTGHAAAEALGLPLAEVFHIRNEETDTLVESPVDVVLREGAVVGLANRTVLVTKDGRRIPIADSGAPIRTADGEIGGVVLIFRDQTAERKAEARVRALLDGAPDAMIAVDREGRILVVNRQCESAFGYQGEELVGQLVELLIPERFRAAHVAERGDASGLAARPMGAGRELHARRKDGTEFPVEISLSPMETDAGRLIITAVRDITERKRLEEQRARAADALQRAYTDFRQVIDKAPDGFTIRRGRTLIYVNPAFAACLGYGDPAELVGADIFDLVYSEDRAAVAERFRAAEEHTVSKSTEIRNVRRDGTVVSQSYSASQLIEFEGAPAYITVARDMTQRNRMEAQLLLSDRMASVGTLAAGVGHEINNPLGAAMANLEVASRLVTDLLARPGAPSTLVELAELLTEAREGAERVRLIVRDLKIFSRSEEELVTRVDVHGVLDSTLRMAWNEIRHRARLVKDYGRVETVAANEARLGQVFLNLVVNAAQAIPEGRAEANEIRVSTRTDASGRVVIEVRDTGPGIPPDVQKQLFTPFFTTKPIGAGTGLGLSICHRIVTALGGEIEVESRPGAGALFRVLLLPAGPELPQPLAVPAKSGAPAKRRGRILIIDDDLMVARAISRILTRDHDTVIAHGAVEAMTRIRAGEHFDVILCDLMMPDVTGMDFFGELSSVEPKLAERVIFVTGGAFTPTAQAFLEEVPNARLEKPVDSHNLQALIRGRLQDG